MEQSWEEIKRKYAGRQRQRHEALHRFLRSDEYRELERKNDESEAELERVCAHSRSTLSIF